MPTDHQSSPRRRLSQRLSFRMACALGLFLLLVMAANILVLDTRGRAVLMEQTSKLNDGLGQTIILKLRERLAATESLTTSLANLGTVLDKDKDSFMRVVPHLMSQAGMEQLIAGGGIWPEPGAFQEGVTRHSFFWGRNEDGSLTFFDDYNDPDGAGYHHEEWYVPARFLQPGQVYWSRSYMDPYSREPMVTCTVPMWQAGTFMGVATIDLKLLGLSEFMREQAAVTGGYAFAVDRNDRLLSLPHIDEVSRLRVSEWLGKQETYPTVAQLSDKHTSLAPLSRQLESMNTQFIQSTSKEYGAYVANLGAEIANQSYQIEANEALNIAANLLGRSAAQNEPVKVTVESDPFLLDATEIKIFSMSDTGWKVLVATPAHYANAAVAKITERMLGLLLGLVAAASLGFVLFFNHAFLMPVKKLASQVRQLVRHRDYDTRLVNDRDDELADLANAFNARTLQLADALKSIEQRNRDLDEAREDAEKANRAKNVFLASMSHEIRTPMNAIIGLSEVLARSKLNDAQQTYVQTLHGSAQSLLSLVNDIMDFSKIEASQLELECIAFDLRHTLDDCADLIAFQSSEKKLDFIYYIDPAIDCRLMGDPNRLRQIVLNLMANAVKFTSSGYVKLWVESAQQGPDEVALRMVVEDTGIGISESALKRLFKPFSQGDSSTTRKYGGTGLGLAISKHLLHLMGGQLSLDSEEGRGSRFTLHLPLKRSHAEADVALPAPPENDTTVLLAVSNHHQASVLQRYCQHLGYQTRCYTTRDAWLTALSETRGELRTVCVDLAWLAWDARLEQCLAEREGRTYLFVLQSPYQSAPDLPSPDLAVFHTLNLPLRYDALRTSLAAPAIRPSLSGSREQSQQGELQRLQGARILVAEDNRVNQQVILLLLKNLGLDADLVNDGVEAVYAAEHNRYDLILMDWQMPNMDGLEATRHIQQKLGEAAPIVIAVTANAMSGDVQQCLAAGMNDYLSKPIRRDELKRMLQRWLVKESDYQSRVE